MADDIASVGIKIETGDIDRANVSLDTLAGKGASVDQSLGKIEGAAAKAGKSLDNLGRGAQSAAGIGDVGAKAQHAAQGIRAVGDNAEKAGHGVKSMAASMGGFGDVLSGIAMKAAAAAGAFVSLNKAFDAAAQWTDMSNRLKMVADGADGLARAQAEVVRIAQATRAPLEATAQLYQRIAQQQDALGMSTSRVAGVVETVSKAMALSGVSAGAANAALVQFGQALASGVLRGDELNSILEQAPGLAMALAEGLGTTTGKLREMGAQGQLTADMVVGALEKQAGAINEQFGKMAPTVSQALTNVNTAFTQFVGKLDEATGLTAWLARTVDFLAKNFDTLAIVLGGSAIVGAVAAFGGLGAAITAVGTAAAVLGGLLLTPIGLAVAAVAGLTAGYIAFKDELNGTGDAAITLGDIFGQVGKAIAGVFGSAQDEAKKTGDASADAAENTIGYWEKGIRGVAALMDKLASVVNGTVLGIGQAIGNVASAMTDVFAKAFNWIAEKAESFINTISRGVNSVTGLLGVNPIGAVSFGRAAVSGVKLDVGGSFDRGMQMGQSSYWGDMAGGFIDGIRSQKASAAAQAASSEGVRAGKAADAKATRDLAEAEERLEQQRIKSLKIDKEYQQTLKDLVAVRDAGRISEAEYVKKVEALATATYKASAAGQEAAKSAKDRKKASDEAAKEAEREAKAVESFLDKIKKKIAAQEQELKSGEKLSDADKLRLEYQEKLISGALKLTAAQKEKAEAEIQSFEANEKALKLQQEQARVYEQASKDYDKYVGTMVREAETLAQKNKSLEDEIEAMGLTGRALVDLERKRIDEQITALKAQHSTAVLAGARDDETAAIRRQIAELERYRELIGQRADKSAAVEEAQRAEEEWKRAADSINQSLTDALLRGFEDGKGFASNFRDTLKNMFRTLVLRPIISFVVQPIGNLIQGAIGGLLGGGQGGAGGLFSTASNANSLFSGASLISNWMGTGAGAGMGTLAYGNMIGAMGGDGLGAFIAANGGWGTSGAGALANSAGSAFGGAAAGMAVVAAPLIFGMLMERFGNSTARITGAASTGSHKVGSTGSADFDMLTGDTPDRAALLARLADLKADVPLDGLNDRALWQMLSQADWQTQQNANMDAPLPIDWDALAKAGQGTADFYRGPGYANPEQLGWWSNDRYYGSQSPFNGQGVDPAMVAQSRRLAEGVAAPLNAMALALGQKADQFEATVGLAFDPDKKQGWWAGLSVSRDGQNVLDFGRREGAGVEGKYKSQDEALRAMFGGALDAFKSFDLPEWASSQVEQAQTKLKALTGDKIGEQAAALYQQAAGGISATFAAIEKMINLFPDFAEASQDAVYALGELTGGLDNLASAYGSYLSNFYSEEERRQLMFKELDSELDKLGIDTIPRTRAEFRELVSAQDLSTEAGREAFTVLMKLSGGFAEFVDAAESAADNARERIDSIFGQISKLWDEQISNWSKLSSEAKSVFDAAIKAAKDLRGQVADTRQLDARTANAYIDQALAGLRATGALPDSKELADAIAAARGGLDMSQYDTLAEMERDQLILAGKLKEIGDSAEVQMSFAEQQVKLLEDQRDYWRQQIDLLNATGETITSIDQGIEYLADYVREQAARKAAEEAEKEAAREAARRASRGTGHWGGGGLGDWGGGGGGAPAYSGTPGTMYASDEDEIADAVARYAALGLRAYAYQNPSGIWSVSPGQAPYDETHLKGLRQYASGGLHSGGLRLVGERGPELEVTGPARYWSHEQTRSMFRGVGGDQTALLEELQALRAEIRELRAAAASGAKAAQDTHNLLDRVSAGGNALLVEAA